MGRFFRRAEGSAVAREILGDKLLGINGLEQVKNPMTTMSKICQFIRIKCSDDFLQACVKVVDPTLSTTRHYVVWSEEHMDRMFLEIKTENEKKKETKQSMQKKPTKQASLYGLLTKCEVKMAGYWSSFFFCEFMDRDELVKIFGKCSETFVWPSNKFLKSSEIFGK